MGIRSIGGTLRDWARGAAEMAGDLLAMFRYRDESHEKVVAERRRAAERMEVGAALWGPIPRDIGSPQDPDLHPWSADGRPLVTPVEEHPPLEPGGR